MGNFIGPPGNTGIVSSGIFGPSSSVSVPLGQFMVVGMNNTNPNVANVPGASFRDASGAWHVVDCTAIGARGLCGVTHDSGVWYMMSNAQAGDSVVGVLPDGQLIATANDTGLSGITLTDVVLGNVFEIGTLANLVITTPDFVTFTSHPAHGPGSYGIAGITVNTTGSSYVCVGLGSGGNGICHSADGLTWASNAATFVTNNDSLVTANTLINDNTQFVAVQGTRVAHSTDGLTWTITDISAATTHANVIGYNFFDGLYYVGDTLGNVLVSATIAGLATATPVNLSSHALRCASQGAPAGMMLLGDAGGAVHVTTNGGVTWVTENPGLGALVLTSISPAL